MVNDRFPIRSIPYIHLHTATPPLQSPARTPTPQGQEGSRSSLPPRDPLLEKTVLTGSYFSISLQATSPWTLLCPLGHCLSSQWCPSPSNPTHNLSLASYHLVSHDASGVLVVFHYTPLELFKLSVNLYFIFSNRHPRTETIGSTHVYVPWSY